IATAYFTQNRSIIHRRFNKTPYELLNGIKLDISFLHVFRALCYPKNDREDIGKLGAKGDIGFFIGYSANSCAYRVYNRRIKKIMETMNVSFDELSAMAFEQHSELDLLFEAMYDDNIVGQPSTTAKTDVDELNLNAMFDGNTFVNPFANPSTSAAESSSSQNLDPSNIHTFYQPYPHEFQWTKDHPLEQVIGEPSRLVLTRNQLRSDGHICMYALTALYGLKQAPRAWYDELSKFLQQIHFNKDAIDPTLFIRHFDDDILVVQDSGFEITGFLDADYAGCRDSFKSTSGRTQLLGKKLVGWSSRKQDCMALSTAKA
nr:retrovirus-related Pol polyprotein from transposon TNT 1-94 [Tanacetum cinerariifolium]